MTEIHEYIKRLWEIKSLRLMTKYDLCKKLNMSYNTLMRVTRVDNQHKLAAKTIRKIRLFVDKYKVNNG